ncbi:MAG: metal ABC transporter permease [Candidatus Nanopelagicales bacterium]|nr:metal ABC transporter permease [Candidatus Nanopelagicales bacterium]MCU0297732.1 metal ABC transporter permease [Candidatus Nanopelagicales bacterium]
MTFLDFDFMRRALLAAMVIGLLAPAIGVFLVQRRLALLGDGMGHVALTGVGLAFLTGTAPVPTALVVAVVGAIGIEFLRARSRSAGDVILALVFYGGIAAGVLLTYLAGNRAASSLNQYLFGAITTVSGNDLIWLLAAAALVAVTLLIFSREMFAVSFDAEVARTQGIRAGFISAMITVLAAVTVVIGMRTVGLLLVSAIMIVPIAAAQQVSRSFRGTAGLGVVIGWACAVSGVILSFYIDVPSGATIVLLTLGCFVLALPIGSALRRST